MTAVHFGISNLATTESQDDLRYGSSCPALPAIEYEKDDNEKTTARVQPTPLPRLQISVLLVMLLSEPCTAAVLFPFINNLVFETGITNGDKSKIGYYAGLIESLFFVAESLFILQYGRLSDRIGRRPVLFFGLAGLAVSSLCFGISKSFAGILISRALAGILNGNAGVIKSVMGELTDGTNASQAFAFIPIVWSIGFTLAPAIGGLLQHPVETMPRLFGGFSILKNYPYLLPCAVVALVPTAALTMGYAFLEETHPVLRKRHSSNMYQLIDSNASSMTLVSPSPNHTNLLEAESKPNQPPPLTSLLTPRVCITILNYALLSLLDISLVALQPIVFASPVSIGGLNLQPAAIGLLLALQGIIAGVGTMIFVPKLQRWFGMRKTYFGGLCLYFVQIWTLPVMHYAVRFDVAGGLGFYTLIGVYAIISCASPISFCCLLLFISNAPPDAMSLGATNGLAQTSASVMRAIGPTIATTLFALSASASTKGTLLVYTILTGVAVICASVGLLMRPEWMVGDSRTW